METRTALEITLLIIGIYFILTATTVGRANYTIVNALAAVAAFVTLFVYAVN